MRHLAEHGQIDRKGLDLCLKAQTRNRMDDILVSVNGSLSEHQRQFLMTMLSYLEQSEAHKKQVEAAIKA